MYWQRTDLKWHRYDPDPEVDPVDDFLAVVETDEYACFSVKPYNTSRKPTGLRPAA